MQPRAALFHASGQAPLWGWTPGIHGWQAGTLHRLPTETHGHSQPKGENRKMWTQDNARGTVTPFDASCTPGVRNVLIAAQFQETRPVLATQA